MRVGYLLVTNGLEKEKRYLLENLSVFEGGRALGSHIFIKDESIAHCHFRIYRRDSEYSIYDLGTSKGTLVNGKRVEKVVLAPGDTIRVGDTELRFDLADDAAPSKEPEAPPAPLEAKTQELNLKEILEPVKAAAYPALMVIDGKDKGQTFSLAGKDRFRIGRAISSDMKLTDAKVSRDHCIVEAVKDHHIIIDLSSSNGTVVNGERIRKTVLKEGDYIRLGFTMIKYDRV